MRELFDKTDYLEELSEGKKGTTLVLRKLKKEDVIQFEELDSEKATIKKILEENMGTDSEEYLLDSTGYTRSKVENILRNW